MLAPQSRDMKKSPPGFSLYPLLWLAVFFSFGILTTKFFAFDWKIYLCACFIFAFLTIVFLKQKISAAFLALAFFCVGAFCLQTKIQSVAENRLKNLYEKNIITSGDPVEIEGVLQTKPELSVEGFFLELKADKAIYKNETLDVSGKVRLFAFVPNEEIAAEYEALNLEYGSRIRVACRLEREDEFLNPGVVSKKEILDQKEIDAVAAIKSPLLVENLGEEKTFAPLAFVYERRQDLILDFKNNFSPSTAGIMIASLLGNKYFLDKQTADIFREGGTFHVLVISGLHITFIGGLTLLFIRFFTRKRFWQFVIAVSFLWAYSFAVGADVPVVRATVMFTILLFSQVIYRKGNLLNSLGACALFLLVWRPEDLFSQSFQLTFMSVASIVAFAFPLIENLREIGCWSPSSDKPFPPQTSKFIKRFCETLYWRERVWEIENEQQIWSANLFKSPYLKWRDAQNLQSVFAYLFEGVLVSLVVQIWLLPLTVCYFHRVTVSSIILNLWVGFFIALESFAAVIALFFAEFSTILALPIFKLTEVLNWLLLFLPKIFIAFDWAGFRVPVYTGAFRSIYFFYYLPILVLTVLLNRWKPFDLSPKSKVQSPNSLNKFQISNLFNAKILCRISALILIFLIALVIFHPFSAPKIDGRLHIEFLDVGQGDSAFIAFPTGETLLIDGGGRINFSKLNDEENDSFQPDSQNIGESVVSQFLWEKGYSKVDYILATHADTDHIQGLTDVAKNFKVRAAFFGRMPFEDKDFAELFEALQKKKIEIVEVSRGDELEIGSAKIQILYPEKDDSPKPVSDNNHSVVLRIVYGTKQFLFTGDIEKETEAKLLENPAFLKSDVVKVAHHGSKTSSTENFINATKAEYAIIPVGRKSIFGHPHREVVERWLNSGAKIKRTGERGTISVSTDGKDLQIETFIK